MRYVFNDYLVGHFWNNTKLLTQKDLIHHVTVESTNFYLVRSYRMNFEDWHAIDVTELDACIQFIRAFEAG